MYVSIILLRSLNFLILIFYKLVLINIWTNCICIKCWWNSLYHILTLIVHFEVIALQTETQRLYLRCRDRCAMLSVFLLLAYLLAHIWSHPHSCLTLWALFPLTHFPPQPFSHFAPQCACAWLKKIRVPTYLQINMNHVFYFSFYSLSCAKLLMIRTY